jgi:hypothetical protein
MSKLSSIITNDNFKEIYKGTESAARGSVEKLLPCSNEYLLRFQSNISAQYITQFSIQALIRANSHIEKTMFIKLKRSILNFTNMQIDLINHPSKIMAKTASTMIMAQTVDNIYARILLLDQFASFQDIDDSKLMEFYPKMSIWLDKSIADCKNKVKKSEFPVESHQMGLFGKNINDASIIDEKTTFRNNKIKK